MRFILFVSFFLFISCSQYQRILKSDNIELKYTEAVEYYDNGDYHRSLPIFESILTEFIDVKKTEDIYYYYIYSLFNVNDYNSSSYHCQNFSKKFPSSERKEEMDFMFAYCYYMQSPRYNLDQENTYKAIDELQFFITNYGNSDRSNQATQLVFDLNQKLEKKDFEIVKLYYDTGKFKSTISAVDDFLNRFPETSFLELIMFIQTQAYYELGKNSIEDKKVQRVKEAIFACDNFLLDFPEGKYNNEIVNIYEELKEIQNGL